MNVIPMQRLSSFLHMTEVDTRSLGLTYDCQGQVGRRFSLLSKDNLISSCTTSNCGRQDNELSLKQAATQDQEYQNMEQAPDSNTGYTSTTYQQTATDTMDAIYDDDFCDHPQRMLCCANSSNKNDNYHHTTSAHDARSAGDCSPPAMKRCKSADIVEDVLADLVPEKDTSISTKMKSYNDESTTTTSIATSTGASCDANTILTKKHSFDPSPTHFCFSERYADNLQNLIDCMDQSKKSRHRVASLKMILKKKTNNSNTSSSSTATTITTTTTITNNDKGDFLQPSSNEYRGVKLDSTTKSMIKEEAGRFDLISDDIYAPADDDDQHDEAEDHINKQLKKRKRIEANHADPINKLISSKGGGATYCRGVDVGMLSPVNPLLTFNEQRKQEEEVWESRSIDVSSIGTNSALPSSAETMTMGMTHDICPVCDVPKLITTFCYHDSSITGSISTSASIRNTRRTLSTSAGGGFGGDDLMPHIGNKATSITQEATEEKSNSFAGSSTSEDAIHAFKVDSSLTVFF